MIRLYTWLLYLLPPAFRRAHGRELLQVARAAYARGDLTAIALAWDLCRAIAREWPHARHGSIRHHMGIALHDSIRDTRYALRLLRKQPGFTVAAVATLALGIGANTAMFTLLNATLLTPIKVVDPDRLASWTWASAYPDYLEYTTLTDTFAGVMAWSGGSRVNVVVDGPGELTPSMFVSANAFSVLGVPAAAGRTLLPADAGRNGPIVAVLSYDYWQSRFGGDANAVGRLLRINGQAVTIVGVADPSFRGVTLTASPAIYLPITATGQIRGGFFSDPRIFATRNFVWLNVVGRLRDGVSIEQASAVVDTRYRQLQPAPPGETMAPLTLTTMATRALGGADAESVRRFVLLLLGVVVLTLLIGCANLANLLLAKSAARRHEVGIRLAVGANRAHVVRQMLVEGILLSLMGGLVALGVATLTLQALAAYQLPGGIGIGTLDLTLDRTTLSATAALAVLTGLLFGAGPAWLASRTDVLVTLRDVTRLSSPPSRLRGTLVAAQVAISLVLLVGSGLFVRSLVQALAMPTGFIASGVATASVNPGLVRYDAAQAHTYLAAALARVRSLPGVTAAAWTNIIPSNGLMLTQIAIHGDSSGTPQTFYVSRVTSEYFSAAGTRLIQGRPFTSSDAAGSPPVAIVSRAAAEKFWSAPGPLGKQLRTGNDGEWRTIIGVVEDVTAERLGEEPVPFVFFPFEQSIGGPSRATDPAHMLVRTSGDPRDFLATLSAALRSVDPQMPVYDVMPFSEHVRELVMPQQMGATLLGLFSLLAVSLAAIGIYGVASYAAQLRSRELGIRLALGADGRRLRRLVLRQAIIPALSGVAIGVCLAFWAARFARAFLLDVSATDPVTFAGVSVLLLLVALAATWIPARRAARLNPVAALRES